MWEAKAEEQGQKGKWMTVSNGTRPYNEDLIEELKRLTDSLEAVKWVIFNLGLKIVTCLY